MIFCYLSCGNCETLSPHTRPSASLSLPAHLLVVAADDFGYDRMKNLRPRRAMRTAMNHEIVGRGPTPSHLPVSDSP